MDSNKSTTVAPDRPISPSLVDLFVRIKKPDSRNPTTDAKILHFGDMVEHAKLADSDVGEGFVKLGKGVLECVPTLMAVLDNLMTSHPYLKIIYLPFQIVYKQEREYCETNEKRATLFGMILDFMFLLVELRKFDGKTDRITPDGQPLIGRITLICQGLKDDMFACYGLLDYQDNHSKATKFLRAYSWNKQLAEYAKLFATRRLDLLFALSLRSVILIEEMDKKMDLVIEMLSKMRSPQEQQMERWILANGGQKAVLDSEEKCAELIKQRDRIISNSPAQPSHQFETSGKPGASKNTMAEDIKALRKEFAFDISTIVREDLESYSKRFENQLDRFSKGLVKDLGDTVQRSIEFQFKAHEGPRSRIRHPMIRHIWTEHGWKGSAQTRLLVLAIRDYFAERIECSRIAVQAEAGISRISPPSDSQYTKQDTEPGPPTETNVEPDPADLTQPLEDDWMVWYLQVKRLRYLPQVLDANGSGFTTISEINNFTDACPEGWSLPRWIAYWAVGWQIAATECCIEIETLFSQMFLLDRQVRNKMIGNKRYVSEYIEGVWSRVTALTSSIERHDYAPPELREKFSSYVVSQTNTLKERLDSIHYVIDHPDAVAEVLRGRPIEESIFVLLALLLKRHVAKIHRCLKQRIEPTEFGGDVTAITAVVWTAWTRFNELKEYFQHQEVPDLAQMFDSVSCGLFNKYRDWDAWENSKYFMNQDARAWRVGDHIIPVEELELVGILTDEYSPPSTYSDVGPEAPSALSPNEQRVDSSSPPTVEGLSTTDVISDSSSASKEVQSITGTWYGYHWTERRPFMTMTRLDIECERSQEQNKTDVTGKGLSIDGARWVLDGALELSHHDDLAQDNLVVDFESRAEQDDEQIIRYNGTVKGDHDILTGTFQCANTGGSFWFKNVMTNSGVLTPEPKYKELWSLDSDVEEMQRKCEKLTKIYRAIGLTFKNRAGLLDDGAEKDEYSALEENLAFEDMSELHELYIWWYDRAGDLQPRGFTCDVCGDTIRRSRVICLDCVIDWPSWTVDLCSKPECIASASLPRRPGPADVTHLPSHLMMKTRDFFLLKDYFRYKQQAQFSRDLAREVYLKPLPNLTPSEEADNEPTVQVTSGPNDTRLRPECKICHEHILSPCWRCIECSNSWVCDPCETGIDGLSPWDFHARFRKELLVEDANDDDSFWDFYWPRPDAHHNVHHLLVRFVAPTEPASDQSEPESPAPVIVQQWKQFEERVQEVVAQRFQAVDERLEKMGSRMEKVDSRITTVVGTIEWLLKAFLFASSFLVLLYAFIVSHTNCIK